MSVSRFSVSHYWRKVTWQEGVWNAEMMTVVAERFVEMEVDGVGFGGEGEESRKAETV